MPKRVVSFTLLTIFLHLISFSQNTERIVFDKSDSTNGYYLVVKPRSNQVKGVLLLLTSFIIPEDLVPETKLPNVTFVNDILMVIAPMKQKLYADSFAINRINTLFADISTRFVTDTSKYAIAGYDEAGNIALRYTELTCQRPSLFSIHPRAVFGINAPVDLFGLWHWSERQIKKNYWQGSVGDAHYYIDNMSRENGNIYKNERRYKELTPFNKESDEAGNEQYLNNVAVRLYYDTDIDWQLKNRRNSYYDTNIPDASELISRLLLSGNSRAEFIASTQPGIRNDGVRHPNSMSIVNEVDCIQWIKQCLDIFNITTWVPPYQLGTPQGWNIERFSLPADFAPQMSLKGIEDIRFAPGWGDSLSEDHWAYAFLWWINGKPEMNSEVLIQNIDAYFNGLVSRNIISRKIPVERQVATKVSVKEIKQQASDLHTYLGNIRMLDYITQKSMTLNAMIHVKNCMAADNTAVFIEISPKSTTHKVWQQLDLLNKNLKCGQ